MEAFDPNAPGNLNNNIFGLPYDAKTAKIIFIPVPWDVTVSYKGGTSEAPDAILKASMQVDLYDPYKKNAWQTPIAMLESDTRIAEKNAELKSHAACVISFLEEGGDVSNSVKVRESINEVDKGCKELNQWLNSTSGNFLKQGKLVGIIGGEHSVPLGFIEALAKHHDDFGVLQIDAHADLRNAYEGFTYSHASAMFNALKIHQVTKLVQLGIRDYCEEEVRYISNAKDRIKTFFDRDIRNALYEGRTWKSICDELIACLPDKVYISFDIDGLDPKLCPNTGTPVPGGLAISEVNYLFERMVDSGKRIIGFDLCEVAPGKDEWDANVAARILYKLANIMAKSNGI